PAGLALFQPGVDVDAELKNLGLHPASLPLGVDIDTWLKEGKTGWDAFPNTGQGKVDAQTGPLTAALKDTNIRLETGCYVEYLEASTDGKTIAAIHYRQNGELKKVAPKLVILSAGAVNSAVILLRSPSADGNGLANRSDQVGRNFMNHNSSAMLAIDPRRRNDAVYQKTLMLNDYYLSDGKGGKPLGNVQLLGKIDGNMLRANVKYTPGFALDFMAGHAVDWYLMCEDLPDPESRIMVDGKDIVMQWRRSNMQSLDGLNKVMRENFRACGYPIVLSRPFDKRTPSHQCGTIKMGDDPATAALDPYCRSFDHRNLFVVDAGFLPNSAAVNPALSIAAQALRVADHIRKTDLAA
ncbi:GMC family oxidoreductase, partial [Mesorhizobium sp. M7A.F.Ca.CA.002.14.1.2]|uniref:GMC oxidoreductase n=1 Tax=Mesorhizobium sp. M7A.F.Ca.CA.002.14.1.2 TaxID=2496740 RepID=UPI000FD48E7C